jgi:mono/diheme cytochrome c family protein
MSCRFQRLALAISAGVFFVVLGTSLGNAASLRRNATADTSVLDGVYTKAQADRGGNEFREACATCHSVDQQAQFGQKYKGRTLGQVFEIISATMPESSPGSLTADQYTNILAYFLSQSGFKAGAKELPTDVRLLKQIVIEPPVK